MKSLVSAAKSALASESSRGALSELQRTIMSVFMAKVTTSVYKFKKMGTEIEGKGAENL